MPVHPLLRAAERVRALAGLPVVVKLGGSAMEEPAATRRTLAAVDALRGCGVRLVMVHGGGKRIDRAMAAAGLTPVKVQGRRYTDDATLAVVVRVLIEANDELGLEYARGVGLVQTEGVHYFGDEYPVRGRQLLLPGLDLQPVDLGRVGQPTTVDVAAIEHLLDQQMIPVLPSLATSEDDGGWLNVNADTAAAAVAGALKAAACLFLTDTPGVLRDVSHPGSLVRRLTRAEADGLMSDGAVGGGMVPKVEACFEALDAGAGSAVILDGRDPHALLDWLLGEPAGTEIVP